MFRFVGGCRQIINSSSSLPTHGQGQPLVHAQPHYTFLGGCLVLLVNFVLFLVAEKWYAIAFTKTFSPAENLNLIV